MRTSSHSSHSSSRSETRHETKKTTDPETETPKTKKDYAKEGGKFVAKEGGKAIAGSIAGAAWDKMTGDEEPEDVKEGGKEGDEKADLD